MDHTIDVPLPRQVFLRASTGCVMATQIGAAVISPLAGIGYDSLGYAHTYLIMSALVASCTFVSLFTLRADAKGTHGLPPAAGDEPDRSSAAV
ncbi:MULTISPECIES: MFS transporter [Streptomyces]|uniref:MFS transporter n=1 Tax=Streptomyces flavovirens TaxID=52258 RepID=A0ABV8NER6_9ACTN|nr:MFS transporter [Streptomyces sp. MBT51]